MQARIKVQSPWAGRVRRRRGVAHVGRCRRAQNRPRTTHDRRNGAGCRIRTHVGPSGRIRRDANETNGTSRQDRREGEIVADLRDGGRSPASSRFADGRVWVANQGRRDGDRHRRATGQRRHVRFAIRCRRGAVGFVPPRSYESRRDLRRQDGQAPGAVRPHLVPVTSSIRLTRACVSPWAFMARAGDLQRLVNTHTDWPKGGRLHLAQRLQRSSADGRNLHIHNCDHACVRAPVQQPGHHRAVRFCDRARSVARDGIQDVRQDFWSDIRGARHSGEARPRHIRGLRVPATPVTITADQALAASFCNAALPFFCAVPTTTRPPRRSHDNAPPSRRAVLHERRLQRRYMILSGNENTADRTRAKARRDRVPGGRLSRARRRPRPVGRGTPPSSRRADRYGTAPQTRKRLADPATRTEETTRPWARPSLDGRQHTARTRVVAPRLRCAKSAYELESLCIEDIEDGEPTAPALLQLGASGLPKPLLAAKHDTAFQRAYQWTAHGPSVQSDS